MSFDLSSEYLDTIRMTRLRSECYCEIIIDSATINGKSSQINFSYHYVAAYKSLSGFETGDKIDNMIDSMK